MTWHARGLALAAAFVIVSAARADAEVIAKSATGFALQHRVEVPGTPRAAYEAFVAIGSWWNPEHTYSRDPARLTLDLRPGGCWCESLPGGGFVQHMAILQASPGGRLVLSGGLGPLQYMAVAATMVVTFAAEGATRTSVTVRYEVSGRDDKSFAELPALVDAVVGEQVGRYRARVTTGAVPRPSGANP